MLWQAEDSNCKFSTLEDVQVCDGRRPARRENLSRLRAMHTCGEIGSEKSQRPRTIPEASPIFLRLKVLAA